MVCYDIKELGKQLKKLGMLIVQDQVCGQRDGKPGSRRQVHPVLHG